MVADQSPADTDPRRAGELVRLTFWPVSHANCFPIMIVNEVSSTRTAPSWNTILSVGGVIVIWSTMTWLFWVGYAGADDMFYARYAFLLHRPPMNWWEFRIPAILAIRGSFLVFGPWETAAALPTLVASLAILTSVAWLVGWPGRINWQTQAAVILAATIPVDVGFRSVPGATFFAAGMLALGTVCILRGGLGTQVVGSVLLTAGFATHELSFFYIAIFCFTALAFDPKRFWRPVLICVSLSACYVVIESLTYRIMIGDFFARWRTAAATTFDLPIDSDPGTGITGVRYFTWPLENLFFCKAFGIDQILLLVTGVCVWNRLTRDQRILFVTTFATWAWLGYGTQVPWSYKPLYRQFHYYGPLILGVAALLPVCTTYFFATRTRWAYSLIAAAVLIHLVCSGAGGRWGADVDVSRQLSRYALSHRDQVFVTDVATMNHMYTLRGFTFPTNVVCEDGPAVVNHLLVNKEPAGQRTFHFHASRVDGILLNLEVQDLGKSEPEFLQFVNTHQGIHTTILPMRFKALFAPLAPILGPTPFIIQSHGGELIATLDSGAAW